MFRFETKIVVILILNIFLFSCYGLNQPQIRKTPVTGASEQVESKAEPDTIDLENPDLIIEKPDKDIGTRPQPEPLVHSIVFVRHAETCQNRREDCGGIADENKFTENGKAQALELSQYLERLHAEKPFTAIYTSNLLRTSMSIESFVSNGQQKPSIKKNDLLDECSGGEVGCYANNNDANQFKSYLRSYFSTSSSAEHILIVGHSRKGYDLMKRNILGDKFWDIRSKSIGDYLENCTKSGRWYRCQSKKDSQVIYREYSHVHNALPMHFNSDEAGL